MLGEEAVDSGGQNRLWGPAHSTAGATHGPDTGWSVSSTTSAGVFMVLLGE